MGSGWLAGPNGLNRLGLPIGTAETARSGGIARLDRAGRGHVASLPRMIEKSGRRRLPILGLILTLALGAAAVYLPVHVVRVVQTQHQEYRGKVDVSGCDRVSRKASHCTGTFRSDDGRLVVKGVEYSHGGRVSRGDTFTALLAGPDDTSANVDGSGIGVLIFMSILALAAIAAFIGALIGLARASGLLASRTPGPATA